MDRKLARFITSVVARQAGLLLVLTGLVLAMAGWLYTSSRESVIQQVGKRQGLLAEQTARGIESYYDAILETLDLLGRADTSEGDSTTQPALGRAGGRGPIRRPRAPLPRLPGGEGTIARQVLLPVFWDQLGDRASHLALYDRRSQTVVAHFQRPDAVAIGELIAQQRDWLDGLHEPAIGPVIHIEGKWLNLVGVPVGRQNPRVIVAAVGLHDVAGRFLAGMSREDLKVSPMLLDGRGMVLGFPDTSLIGRNVIEDGPDEASRQLAAVVLGGSEPQTRVVPQPHRIGGTQFQPAVLTLQPMHVCGERWWLLVATELSQIDNTLGTAFKRIFAFAAVAIGVFTFAFSRIAIGQIRARAREERVKNEMLRKELQQARRIQMAWLPADSSKPSGLDIAAVNSAANHISGDFYNWFELDDGRSCVVIGDVTGHGMSAAFLMATTQLLIRAAMQRLSDPGEALTAVNSQLCQQVFNGQFVTLLILVINRSAGQLLVANAGHPPPVWICEGGEARFLGVEPQLVAGVDADCVYPTQAFELAGCHGLILYTDGVPEASAENDTPFGNEGLLQSQHPPTPTAQQMLDALQAALSAFRGQRELQDDVTIVALRPAPR